MLGLLKKKFNPRKRNYTSKKIVLMKALIEKQILEWQQEIIKQNSYVLKLEGGIQAYQLLLRKINEEEEKTGNIELGVKNEKK